MSRLVYRSDANRHSAGSLPRRTILEKVCIKELFFSEHTSVQWTLNIVEKINPFAVLVFRGTSGFENWLANLKVMQSPWKYGGQVHSGFKAIFLEIKAEIKSALQGITKPVFYTGHSLGAALAVLAASVWPPQATYTFGSPRVGDAVFRERLSGQSIYRITNDRDIVTSVPPSRIPFEFCHVGEAFRFQLPGGQIPASDSTVDTNTPETGRSPAGVDQNGLFSNPPRFLSEHAPINYSAGLAQYLLENPDIGTCKQTRLEEGHGPRTYR